MKKADVEDGSKTGVTDAERSENRELKKRLRLLEQENEVLRRAAAYLSQPICDRFAPLSPMARYVSGQTVAAAAYESVISGGL